MLSGTERIALPQRVARHAHDLLPPSLSQRLPPRLPLGRRRLGRGAPPVQRPQGPRLRLQSRARRPDHGRAGASRSIRSRPTAPSCASTLPRPLLPGRLDDGRDGLGRAALDGAAPPGTRRAAASTSPSGIPRSWSTTATAGRSIRSIPAGEFYGEFGALHGRSRRARGPGHRRHRRAGLRRPRLGARQSRARPSRSSTSATTTAPRTPSADACDGAGAGPKADPLVRRATCTTSRCRSTRTYRYEGGHFGDVAVHVLYQPGDDTTWGGGVAVERTETALAWLDQLFGPFGWPQITNVHRIEGGGTEFPMMIHDGSADQGLIVHELGHNYTMGILANNEWREGWLDEGFTSFQTSWFWEATGQAGDATRRPRRRSWSSTSTTTSEPPSLVSEAYRDFTSYNIAIYTRGELFFHQLRDIVGDDDDAPDPADVLRALEATSTWTRRRSGRWPRRCRSGISRPSSRSGCTRPSCTTTRSAGCGRRGAGDGWVDAGRGGAEVARPVPGGRRRPRRRATRRWRGPTGWPSGSGSSSRPGPSRSRWCSIRGSGRTTGTCSTTGGGSGSRWPQLAGPVRPARTSTSIRYFSTRTRRDRLTVGLQPVALVQRRRRGHPRRPEPRATTSGGSSRTSAMVTGEHRAGEWTTTCATSDFWFRLRNPVFLRAPNAVADARCLQRRGPLRRHADASSGAGATHLTFGPDLDPAARRSSGCQPDDFRYLDPGYYDDVGHGRAARSAAASTTRAGKWQLELRSSVGGGLAYNRDGLAGERPDRPRSVLLPRVTIEGTARRPLGARLGLGARGCTPACAGGDHARGQAAADLRPGRRSARAARQSVPALAGRAARGRGHALPAARRRRRPRARSAGVDRRRWSALNVELERTVVIAAQGAAVLAGGARGVHRPGARHRREHGAAAGRPHPLPRRRGRRHPGRASDRRHAVRHPASICRCG